ncbi:Na+/H+ antiporter NhaA [Pontixanthobacter aestiaquae]|uniref:Na(+)/H(+) antiporter NhaA n=1 Tax=Pontixanthobacter aestiaquae TaxID=1509367 RepID=A0A844Z6L3_9SPHN|nr:Na+/H+ antiporter NhaA [Pontixanthobacter aestiaquae]MDN3646122.1 Na+/H+ antiporter NhaA [Pontixanthobacter aestiaquae]MXO82886.1 Na+/H+ antiporter NhaA [Pontixanthobacter aestiaquae]
MANNRLPLRSVFAPVRALFVGDASAGVLLILVAAAAMLAANSDLAGEYNALFNGKLAWTPIEKLNTLHYWINDGLMAIFFFVVGLEVKREIICGQLATPEQRRLPMLAAVAGMLVPAGIYIFIAGGDPQLTRGWAIPAATDIAFAMGVLGLLGNRVPASLRLFLLTVAIVDDIGAVMVIAVFYTANIKLMWVVASLVVLGVMMLMNRLHVSRILPYILVALVLWFCVLNSGVHATIAGVVAALTIPMHRKDGNSLLEKLEHGLAPWSAYAIVPIFGFANAGVNLSGIGMEGILAPLPLAVAAGLVVGKQVGIFTTIFVAAKIGFAKPPKGASWAEIWGVSILCGIGFTMSLFIGELAFPNYRMLIDEAKIGILAGSVISAVMGYVILRMTTTHPNDRSAEPDPV